MLPGEFVDALKSQLQAQGSGFALTEDAVKAVLHIATEKTMNGWFLPPNECEPF